MIVPYRPLGAARQLFLCRDFEVLLEGPAGTGKTRALLEYLYFVAVTYPGVRILLVRKTRASLTESAMVTWESRVIPDDACMRRGGAGVSRHSYEFDWAVNEVAGRTYAGRSRIVLGGMDKPSKIMSTEFDLIAACEARELTEKDWQALITRVRNNHTPWQQIIADTNPDHALHWLNIRASRPIAVTPEIEALVGKPRPGQTQMTRLLSRHKDNPFLWDHEAQAWHKRGALYIAQLQSLRNADRLRYLDGEWGGGEGQVWDTWDRARHMAYLTALDHEGRPAQDGHRRDSKGRLQFDWYFASFDWGHRAPGCLQVWGAVGKAERIYRIHEVYRRALPLDAWAELVARYWQTYELARVVCDPSRPDLIEMLNRRLVEVGARNAPHLVVPGTQEKAVRIDTVRYGLDPGEGQGNPGATPRLYLCWDATEMRDNELAEQHKPTCTEEEIPSYVWAAIKDGRPLREETDPLCADHGCDAMQYAAVWAFGKDLSAPTRKPKFDPDSLGAILGHDQVSFDA